MKPKNEDFWSVAQIDRWFLTKMKNIITCHSCLKTDRTLRQAVTFLESEPSSDLVFAESRFFKY